MGRFGVDYSYSRPDVAAMAADGVTFACRYLRDSPGHPGKALTAAEAAQLAGAGIAVVGNDETTGVQYLGGYDGGHRDAQAALAAHLACGGPVNGRPVYFSPLDHDPAGLDAAGWGLLRDYARGVVDVLGVARTGWYGGTRMLRDLRGRDLGRWWWQSLGWRDGVWLDWAHIQQYDNGQLRWGGEVDYDRALTADFGQWPATQGDMSMPDAQQILDELAKLRKDLTVYGTTGLEQTVEAFASRQRQTLGKLDAAETALAEINGKLDQLIQLITAGVSVTLTQAQLDEVKQALQRLEGTALIQLAVSPAA